VPSACLKWPLKSQENHQNPVMSPGYSPVIKSLDALALRFKNMFTLQALETFALETFEQLETHTFLPL